MCNGIVAMLNQCAMVAKGTFAAGERGAAAALEMTSSVSTLSRVANVFTGIVSAAEFAQTGNPMALLGVAGSALGFFGFFGSCFTGDMLVDVEGGKRRAEEIQEGDKLWSRDEHDPEGELALKVVEERFVRLAAVWNVRVGGQLLRTTGEHPFWVVDREGNGRSGRWLMARELSVGDQLLTREGSLVSVESVEDAGIIETVYNWRIADYHTYYVSETEDGASIWAHNECKTGPKTDNRFGHNRTIRRVAREVTANGDTVIAGGRSFDGANRKEQVFQTPNGFKSSRRPDVLVQRPDGSIYGINVGRTQANGQAVLRERLAIQDLNEIRGLEMHFVGYRKRR
jgi:hypothetical protein